MINYKFPAIPKNNLLYTKDSACPCKLLSSSRLFLKISRHVLLLNFFFVGGGGNNDISDN